MQQRDAGKLRLDDPVAAHLPWFDLKHGARRGRDHDRGPADPRVRPAPRVRPPVLVRLPTSPFPTREQIVGASAGAGDALRAGDGVPVLEPRAHPRRGDASRLTSGMPTPTTSGASILDPLGLRDHDPEMPESRARPAPGHRLRRAATATAAARRCRSSRRTGSRRPRATRRAPRTWRASRRGSSGCSARAAPRCWADHPARDAPRALGRARSRDHSGASASRSGGRIGKAVRRSRRELPRLSRRRCC